MMLRKLDAVNALHPNADYAISGDGKITAWNGQDITQPSESEIDAKLAELQAAEPMRLLRIDRNKLLAESDWTGLADSALTSEVSAKWKLYRQKLRNLPSGLNTPAKVKAAKWPTKPV
tara:strand:+ start:301 stop:654 length:354 start_codon:yes stop_codon:yes gene_type:complete